MYFFQGNNGSREIKPIQKTNEIKEKGLVKKPNVKPFCYLLIKKADRFALLDKILR